MFADVILPLKLPQLLTYGVPIEMQDSIRPGMRVEVALGKNKQYAGVVDCLHERKPETYQVKPIRALLDESPIVNEYQLKFWRWIGDYYMAAPGEVMQAALPAHLKLSGETRLEWIAGEADMHWSSVTWIAADALKDRKELTISELKLLVGERALAGVLNELLEREAVSINDSLEAAYKPRKEKIITLATAYEEEPALMSLFNQLTKAPRQLEVLMAYTEIKMKKGLVKQADLTARIGGNSIAIKSLADKGIFVVTEVDVDRIPLQLNPEEKEVSFTPGQQQARELLGKSLAAGKVTLLHGVTGSGKTLLYVQEIRECLASGRQVLLLLPEIALTTQLVRRLLAYFGESLGVYHSHFSNNERVEIWEKVRKGIYQVVVGPRSALWLPYSQLGLVIVDEEHDGSYKQRDPAPRFHARDAAIFLAGLFNARVLLGSATPALESLYNVQNGKYGYVPLKERYMGVNMPAIEIAGFSVPDSAKRTASRILSARLVEEIEWALKHDRQVILFQNKRGYSPFQMCTSCGWVPQCKNCAVSLTYHKSTDKLHCHYCGARSAVIQSCPACGHNQLASKSFGTEKIEEEVQTVFPKARVARMDVDSMRRKNSMVELLDQLEKRKIDILVGTQMVVKGLDLANVSLVGILSADSLLGYPDFRVNERAFQLMEQVSGRAGRTDGAGRVVIQAFNMQHPVLKWVTDHDVKAFYASEIRYREHFGYPPFTRIIKVILRHESEARTIDAATLLAQELVKFAAQFQIQGNAEAIPPIHVQGPGPAIVAKVRNQYIQEIWLKCTRDMALIARLKTFLKGQKQAIQAKKGNGNVQIIFDVDPV